MTTVTRQRTLTGVGTLLRFMLRRDRIRTSAWVLGLGVLAFYFAHAIQAVVEDEEALQGLAAMLNDPVGRMMVGPGFGLDNPTYERMYAAEYVLFIYIGFALMSVFTVIRHTRVDEQTGRGELIRSNVVGRHAVLTATVIITAGANVLVAAMVGIAGLSAGYATQGSLLVAAGALATGLLFTGVAAVSAQLSEFSRTSSAIAGAVIAVAYLIRMGGDVAEPGGTALSWFSPLAWVQQTAPYVYDRWWPLLLPLGFAVVLTAVGYRLSTRRDVGSSLMSTRRGRSEAHAFLGTPVGMAARALRGGLRGWGVALVIAGLMFGGFAQAMVDSQDSLPPELSQIVDTGDMLLGYFGFMALFLAMFVAAAGVSAVQQVREEESSGRAEFALSASVGRTRWLGAHLAVIGGALVFTLVVVGVATAVGSALALGDWSFFGEVVLAGVLQAPAVLATLGIVVALFGWLPRAAVAVGWVIVVFAVIMSSFGALLDLPGAVTSLDVFSHLAEYPVEDVAVAPVLWLSLTGVGGVAAGMLGWRRREVNRV